MWNRSLFCTPPNMLLRSIRNATTSVVLKRVLPLCAALLLGLTLGGTVARAQSSLPLLDDFTTGHLQKPLTLRTGRVVDYQRGDPNHLVGGFRTTVLAIATNQFNQTATLDIPRGGPLLFNSDIKVFPGLQVVYGQDSQGRPNPLNLPLSSLGYDRFRLDFDSSDQQLHITITVYWEGGAKYAGFTVDRPASFMAFSVDFPFADFVSVTPPVDFNDIDVIVWQVTGSGASSLAGGADFAVTKFSVSCATCP